MSDRYFKEHIFCHPPDEGHVRNSSDFLIRWHPSRGQLRVDGLNLHPERWNSHKKISNLSFGTSGEWQSVRSAPLGIFYQVDLFLLRNGALDITAGYKYCGTLLKNLSGFLVFCVAWISEVEIQNFMDRAPFVQRLSSGLSLIHTTPSLQIARKKRYTCAVASLQSPASDSHRFVFTECNR